jgi:hypothetical protein
MANQDIKDLELGHPNQIAETYAPEWLRNPATIQPIVNFADFTDRANLYFEECHEQIIRPTITGLALATGLPGPTSLIRLGQRVPELRAVISRCMTAVAHGYEQLIGLGGASAGAQFMLKNIPDFDPEDPVGEPGVQFFNDRKEILLQADVYGAATMGEDYDANIDPVEVYMSVIRKPGGIGKISSVESEPGKKLSPQQRLFSIIEPGNPND